MIWGRAALAGIGFFAAFGAAAQELRPTLEQPSAHNRYSAVGMASWYGKDFGGRPTADGEIFDTGALTAAHRTMPLPSYARVTNLGNGRSIVVRVNDRGPFVGRRILDVSARVAKLLDFRNRGLAKVRLDYLGKAPPAGSDESTLLASLNRGGAPAAEGETVAERVVENPPPAGPRSPYGELIVYRFGDEAARPTLVESQTFVARVVERPPSAESRSPYGELVAFPFAEEAALRWGSAPHP